jgi:hypothetical protein
MQKVRTRTSDIAPDELLADARPNEGSSSSLAVTVLLALSLLWCVLWFVHSWGYWEDDSFIHLEFARSLASGHGFAFNGNVVYGDTAPLWVFLLVGFHLLIPNWIVAGKILAASGTLFALTGVYAFSRRLTAPQPGSRVFSAAMVLLFVLNPFFCYWSFSGMETLTAAGLALWAVVAATTRPLSWKRFLLGCALAGVGPLLRPEMVFFAAILALVLFYRRLQTASREPSPREPSRLSSLAGFASGLALLTGPTIAWAIYALHTFGRIIPNTNAAKRASPGESVILRLINIYSLGFPIIVCGCIAGLIYLVLRFSTLRQNFKDIRQSTIFSAGAVFALWTVIATAFYIVDRTHVQTRYVFVSAVGLAVVVFAALLSLSLRIYRPALIACLAFAAAISIVSVWPFIRNKNVFVETVRQQSLFFHNQLPPDAPVAGYNIGEIAFFSEHPIVDTGGITRPGAIPYLSDPDGMVKWIHSQGGAYYVTFDQPEPGATLVFSQPIPFVGWSLHPHLYSHTDQLNVWKLAPPATTPTEPAH